jgi:hypothetical protein
MKQSIQINDIISLSSFEIVKNLQIPLVIYVAVVVVEIVYLILIPA